LQKVKALELSDEQNSADGPLIDTEVGEALKISLQVVIY